MQSKFSFKKALGLVMKEKRESAGYTQEQIAAGLDVTSLSISRWERGETEPDWQYLYAFGKAVNSSALEILAQTQANLTSREEVREILNRIKVL